MKFAFLTTGLVASLLACPWFVAQESGPAPTAQKPGFSSSSPSPTFIAVQSEQQRTGQAPNSNGAPSAVSPQLPTGYTERAITVYGNPSANNVASDFLSDAKARQAIAKAFQAYQSAADDAAREKATAELKAGLEQQYDAYVEAQAKQITHLEERLQKLKEQLEKRRSAKDRMVDLKLQMVLSQAEGLGFPDNGFPNAATIYGDAQNRYQVQDSSSLLIPNAYPALVPAATAPVAPHSLPPLQVLPPAAPAPQTPAAGGGDQNRID